MNYYIYQDKKKKQYWVKYLNKDEKWSTKRGFSTKKSAEKFVQKYMETGMDDSIKFNQLFQHYLDDYLRLRPSSSAKKLESWFKTNVQPRIGNKPANSIKIKDLEKLSIEMLKKGYSRNYINKMTLNVKTVLNFGVSHGYIEKNPVALYKELKIIKNSDDIKFWTPEQFGKAIKSIDELYVKADTKFMKFFLLFAYYTGLRKGEIRALKWNNIDFSSNLIHVDYHINDQRERVKGRKNGNGYSIYMDKTTKQLVLEMHQYFKMFDGWNENAYVFPSLMKGFDYFLGDHTPTRWMENLAKENNLPHITFHGLRHSAVVYWISIGLNVWEIAEKIGDTTDMVYKVYGGYMSENKVRAAEKLDKHSENLRGFLE